MKHTLESIAALAGVSRGTVSRVINNQPGVKPLIRERVLDIIAQTGYVPHPQARCLAGGRTGNIGVIVFGSKSDILTHHIFYEALQGIQAVSAYSEYDLLLHSAKSGSNDEHWKTIAAMRKVDGLIIMGENIKEEHLRYYRQQRIPYVLIGKRVFDQLPLVCVTTDYRSGACQATRHLLEQGRRQIVYIQGMTNTYHEDERYAGYCQALLESGIPVNPDLIIVGKAEQETAHDQMKQLIERGTLFDAVFAANDLMAFGAIEALQAHDYSVPEEIRVIGYDDIEAAAYSSPALTTVRQNKKALGEEAAKLLLDMLRGELAYDEEKDIVIASALIVRGSA